jgi:hypothetical protein
MYIYLENKMLLFVKIVISALLIAFATEVARYNRILAAMIISLPLTSMISFVWIYLDLRDTDKLSKMSMDVFWLVLLSLPFFLAFSYLLRMQYSFWIALGLSCALLIILYCLATFFKSYF